MITNQFDTSAILNSLSAIAALSAVILAILSERRAQKRFEQSNEIQERIAAGNIRPLLRIRENIMGYDIKITLNNDGLGPAVITNITFTKENRSGNSIGAILDTVKFGSVAVFSERPDYLRAGEHINLYLLSAEELNNEGLKDSVPDIFRDVKSRLKGTKISIELEDVLGNKQSNVVRTLD
ncbi:MAG TPA: hypothetical protein VJZ32_06365 [Candidatus Bathyarchaeia archaeon]|nr:hypothetical protein [Candidatus Bathyarchaeia archaeon]